MQMILLDAIFINNGGGKILLDFLIESLEKSNVQIHYLLDDRIRNSHPVIKENKVTYLQGKLSKRHAFYKSYGNAYKLVFCFANMPPTLRLNAKVYTYFHQFLFLKLPKKISVKNRVVFYLKRIFLMNIKNNSDFWMVQSDQVRQNFNMVIKPKILSDVNVVPFYPSLTQTLTNERVKSGFLYVSGAAPHKNHVRLIQAFCKYYDDRPIGELKLTVSEEFIDIIHLIAIKKKEGYPIINLGFLEREKLTSIYLNSEYVIYPSLAESFGLGLLEGMECGCKIIAADLPYTYAVCKPSIVFDPLEIDSIAKAFKQSTTQNLKPTIQLVENRIDKIVKLFQVYNV